MPPAAFKAEPALPLQVPQAKPRTNPTEEGEEEAYPGESRLALF